MKEPEGEKVDDTLLRQRLDPIEARPLELADCSFRRMRSSGLLFLLRRKKRRAESDRH